MGVNLRAVLVLLCALMVGAPAVATNAVVARDYDAFYLWPGVHAPGNLKAATVYLLDGEIRRAGKARFRRLRATIPRVPATALWLVVRIDRLDLGPETYATIFDDLEQWQRAGNHLLGLQIDFDAATHGLGGYVHFLQILRERLPRRWQLSVTGLMDWSAHGDPHALLSLSQLIDEVVVQTYQGRHTIHGYEAYFRQMGDFPIPFKVALAEGGDWQPPAGLGAQRNFRGYVVFLLSPPR